MTNMPEIPCLILAGGQSRRMGGGDKFLKTLGGKSLLERVLETIEPQVGEILLSQNSGLEHDTYPVRPDCVSGHLGPLVGILTGLEYFREKGCEASHMLSIPADAPFIPDDLVSRLKDGLGTSEHSIVMAYSKERIHPVVALWPFELTDALRIAVTREDLRKILVFAERYSLTSVRWEEGDPFFNINRPEDLEAAEKLLAGSHK